MYEFWEGMLLCWWNEIESGECNILGHAETMIWYSLLQMEMENA